MKSLRLLFSLSVLASFFFTSCMNEASNIEEQKRTDDTELISNLYASDALTGIGEVKDGDEYTFTIATNELSPELQAQLEGKEHWAFDKKMSISPEVMERIWGDKIKDTSIENGFEFEAKEYEVTKTYMTPDGESLTEQIKDDPSILANAREIVIDYLYVSVTEFEIVDGDGDVVGGGVIVYVESCTIIIP